MAYIAKIDQPIEARNLSDVVNKTIEVEASALLALRRSPPAQLCDAAQLIHAARGPLVVAGIGKSGHIGQKISSTFRSLGKKSVFLHAAEASHGDLGVIDANGVVLVISNSGETTELSDLLAYCSEYNVPVISITANQMSTLGMASQIVIAHGKLKEACLHGLAPTTSTTVALAIGDALAVGVSHLSNIEPHDFRRYHPGGKLGARLLKVADLMHRGDALPIVTPDTAMQDAVITMSSKGFGTAIVCQDDTLIGLITDGDMRRNVNRLWKSCANDLVLGVPMTISPDTSAASALALMSENAVTAVLVVDSTSKLLGLIHIHDCLRAGVGN